MTSHGVAPPGLSAGKSTLSLGLAPQAIRCRPSGTKNAQLQKAPASTTNVPLGKRDLRALAILNLVQAAIEGAATVQFVVGAEIDDLAFVEH